MQRHSFLPRFCRSHVYKSLHGPAGCLISTPAELAVITLTLVRKNEQCCKTHATESVHIALYPIWLQLECFSQREGWGRNFNSPPNKNESPPAEQIACPLRAEGLLPVHSIRDHDTADSS
jgi:hypothetical protein